MKLHGLKEGLMQNTFKKKYPYKVKHFILLIPDLILQI